MYVAASVMQLPSCPAQALLAECQEVFAAVAKFFYFMSMTRNGQKLQVGMAVGPESE